MGGVSHEGNGAHFLQGGTPKLKSSSHEGNGVVKLKENRCLVKALI